MMDKPRGWRHQTYQGQLCPKFVYVGHDELLRWSIVRREAGDDVNQKIHLECLWKKESLVKSWITLNWLSENVDLFYLFLGSVLRVRV